MNMFTIIVVSILIIIGKILIIVDLNVINVIVSNIKVVSIKMDVADYANINLTMVVLLLI